MNDLNIQPPTPAQDQPKAAGTCGCGGAKPGGCDKRLREKPEERFEGTVHRHTISEAFKKLEAEVAVGHQGHRQITLYQDKGLTVAAFEFAPGAKLRAHSAPGEVVVQGVDGELQIIADGQSHLIGKGDLLVMRPGVVHEVFAPKGAKMLLTVIHKAAAAV